MALFGPSKPSPVNEVMQLRQQGLTDDIIMEELAQKGYSQQDINNALAQTGSIASEADQPGLAGEPSFPSDSEPEGMPTGATGAASGMSGQGPESGNIYERIEEIAESMIDEKWDELIAEVKKIIEWKSKIEEKQTKINADLAKLKEDFKVLHQGVLGKLEDYDTRMQDVGTELKAVGQVFKDVVPQFVQNVKDLSKVTGEIKKKK